MGRLLSCFRIIILVFLLACNVGPSAQPISFRQLTVDDGLQNNIVFATTQDHKGFLWFATLTGIDRFDGNSFMHYKVPNNSRKQPEVAQVNFIITDNHNRIWAASGSTLLTYNHRVDQFEAIGHLQKIVRPNAIINSLMADSRGRIWIGLNNGLCVYDPSQEKVFTLAGFNNFVRSMHEDQDAVVWTGTNKGLLRLFFSDDRIKEVEPEEKSLEDHVRTVISSVTQDNLGRFWIGTVEQGLWVLDYQAGTATPIRLSRSAGRQFAVKDVYHDGPQQRSFVALDGGGLFVVNRDLTVAASIQSDDDRPGSLNNNGLYDIYLDRYDRMWLSTYGSGVNYWGGGIQPFTNYLHEPHNRNSLVNNMAKCVTEDKGGDLWFGTRKGISRFSPSKNTWLHLNVSSRVGAMTSDNILALIRAADGNIWAGTYGGGLLKISPRHNSVVSYRADAGDSTTLGTDYVYAVCEDRRQFIWSGGIRGALTVLNPGTGTFTKVPLQANSINCIVESTNGTMMVGTEKGAFSIRTSINNKGELVFTDIRPLLQVDKVSIIFEREPGIFWVGTQGDGITVVDSRGDIIKKLNAADGLPSDIVYGILKDNNGDLWISTTSGIAHFEGNKGIITFTKADGLAGSQFNPGAYYKTSAGHLIFGSTNGFTRFDPLNVKTRSYVPRLVFTKLLVNNEAVSAGGEGSPLAGQLDDINAIRLSHKQNTFTITFANLAPAVSGKHLYSWRLKGLEEKWTPFSGATSAMYTKLDPGKYVLQVKTSAKGKQSQAASVREIEILIQPPWWRTGWANAAYLLLVAGLAYAAYSYYKVRNIRRLYAERLKLQTNIAHEIRTPLTLIKGPISAMAGRDTLVPLDKNNIELAQRNVEKLEHMITQFIDYQNAGLNKLHMQLAQYDLVDLLDKVASSFEPLLREKNLTFSYRKDVAQMDVLLDKEKIERVLSNLIFNAIKYTPEGGMIELSVQSDQKDAIIRVSDTGIGIPEREQRFIFKGFYRAENTMNLQEKGSGIGLSIAKEMVELHKGTITFKSAPGKGTVFTIRLPLKNVWLESIRGNSPAELARVFSGSSATTEPGSTSSKLLVVEDNNDLRAFLVRELTETGYKVSEAANGMGALQVLKKGGIDLVLTDVMMPEMNGFQLCAAIKKEINTCHIPVIMLTAIHDKDYLLEGYRSGADDYVKKPFDRSYIVTRIENLLQNRTWFRNKIMSVFEHQEAELKGDTEIGWLKEVTETILKNLTDPDFSVEKLSSLMAMSRPVLFRKFKAITGDSPQQYINLIRLRRAVELLQTRAHNINEVAYMTGFGDPKYFSTVFKKQYGKTPSQYVQDFVAA